MHSASKPLTMNEDYGTLHDLDGGGTTDGGPANYKTYCSRWLMLALFCGLTFTNSFLWISFSSIEVFTAQFYEVSPTAVNFLSVIFMIMYVPGSLLTAYYLSSRGFRFTIVLGALFNVSGAWLRYLSIFVAKSGWIRYGVLFLGQLICAMGQPFFVNTSAKLAGDWFGASERDLATVVASLVNPIGNAAGQALPPMFVSCGETGDSGNKTRTCHRSDQVHGMGSILLLQAVVASLTSGLAFLLFKRAPPTPPSASAFQRNEIASRPQSGKAMNQVKRDVWAMLQDKQVQRLMVGFGLGLGIFNALLTVLAQVLKPVYYDADGELDKSALSSDAGLYGLILIGSGLVGAGIFGYLLDVTHAYRMLLKVLFTCSSISMMGFFLSVRPDNHAWIATLIASSGFFALPLLPVALQSAVECTYPIPEELSSAILVLFGNLVAVGCTFGLQSLLELKGYGEWDEFESVLTPSFWFVSSIMMVAWASILSFQGEYKRLHAEAKGIQ